MHAHIVGSQVKDLNSRGNMSRCLISLKRPCSTSKLKPDARQTIFLKSSQVSMTPVLKFE